MNFTSCWFAFFVIMVYVKYHDFIATANISVLNTEISVLKVGIPRLMWSVFRAAKDGDFTGTFKFKYYKLTSAV